MSPISDYKIGMLWCDSRPLDQALQAAMARFNSKYPFRAQIIFVSDHYQTQETERNGVPVIPVDWLPKAHLIIGVKEYEHDYVLNQSEIHHTRLGQPAHHPGGN